ncbi:MAG: hypothetical protein KatS3mg110_0141 [Pirellulaceae bacterium]|nr:MAG: hypothetical protein KatS3mg110_0141 [Pirellulaceae bacterium]
MAQMGQPMRGRIAIYVLGIFGIHLVFLGARADGQSVPAVSLRRLPDGEIQPQIRVSNDGTLHMLTFRGDARGGDLWYRRQPISSPHWSEPIRVNHSAGTAVAAGTIRGGRLAVGYDGRVHVVWNGARPIAGAHAGPADAHSEQLPLYYTRSDPEGTRFEPERNVIRFGYGLDGGSDVAVDRKGNVYVVWHGKGEEEGEAHRRVYVAVSADNGEHFQPEQPVNWAESGVCACCTLAAINDPDTRNLLVLFRAAPDGFNRDMFLLDRTSSGQVRRLLVGRWQIGQCPMSSAAFATAGDGIWAAWESAGQIYVGKYHPKDGRLLSSVPLPGPAGQRRHPSLAVDAQGRVLCAWSEGTGWNRPGRFAWVVLDPQGTPLGSVQMGGAVPVWSFVAAYAQPAGGFVIVH